VTARDEPISKRQYSPEEIAAARRLRLTGNVPGRGAIYFAGGDYWSNELDRRAQEFERDAARARMLAAALRREQER
jgi:hypothetical protein